MFSWIFPYIDSTEKQKDRTSLNPRDIGLSFCIVFVILVLLGDNDEAFAYSDGKIIFQNS